MEEYHVYGLIYREKLHNNRMPYIMAESAYEFERNENTQTLRRQAYWSLLSGACGHFFGNRDVWVMNKNWESALRSAGHRSMQIFYAFVLSIPWYRMNPDWEHLVFISGRGSFNGGTDPGGEDYATASFTADHSTGIIYLPSARKIGVNLERFSRPLKVKWFDPSSGSYTVLPKTYTNKGISYFEPPNAINSEGFGDWVLVIEPL